MPHPAGPPPVFNAEIEAEQHHVRMLQATVDQLHSDISRMGDETRTRDAERERIITDLSDKLSREQAKRYESQTTLADCERALRSYQDGDMLKNHKVEELRQQSEMQRMSIEQERRHIEEQMEQLRRAHE